MTGQLSPLAQGKAAGTTGYTSKLLKTGQTTQYNSELDDGYYEVGVEKSYTVNTAGAQSGTTNVDLTHLVSDTGAFTAADKTYTDAGKCGVFKAAGGETIVITGSTSNNGTFTTVSATANTVVFVEAITDEADAPETTFKKREAMSNNTVLDNNTGLTWMRYKTVKMGTAGDGKLNWTGNVYSAFRWCEECNAVSVGGHNDWRIPNLFEFISLGIAESLYFHVDTTVFPNYGTGDFVNSTSTSGGGSPTTYYAGSSYWLSIGGNGRFSKATANYCVLVRGGIA